MEKKKSAKDMTKKERLDAAASSIRDALDPSQAKAGGSNRSYPDALFNMDIAPPKPDPERKANATIERAVNGGRSAEIMKMIEARKNNPINPMTGMPEFSSGDDSVVREAELLAPKKQSKYKFDAMGRLIGDDSVVREAELRDPSAVTQEELTAAPQEFTTQDEERRAIRMQLLREAAKTGQMPGYLKKY